MIFGLRRDCFPSATEHVEGMNANQVADLTVRRLEKESQNKYNSPDVRRQTQDTAQMLRDLKARDPQAYESFGAGLKANNNRGYHSLMVRTDELAANGPNSLRENVWKVVQNPADAVGIIKQNANPNPPSYKPPPEDVRPVILPSVSSPQAPQIIVPREAMPEPPFRARRIYPQDIERPQPIRPVYQRSSSYEQPSLEDRAIVMGNRIKELEAQGYPESRARFEVHKQRQTELINSGVDPQTARSMTRAEATLEKRIDDAQENAQRNNQRLGNTVADWAGMRGNERTITGAVIGTAVNGMRDQNPSYPSPAAERVVTQGTINVAREAGVPGPLARFAGGALAAAVRTWQSRPEPGNFDSNKPFSYDSNQISPDMNAAAQGRGVKELQPDAPKPEIATPEPVAVTSNFMARRQQFGLGG